MNKQNSMGMDNEMSTEINQSTKGYSSRFKQLKAIKSNTKCRYSDVLPFKLEKAAVVIQRFWRFRKVIRKKLYQQMLEELDYNNQIIEFQNSSIDNLIKVYSKDCQQLEEYLGTSAKASVEKVQIEAKVLIKQMAIITFKMQKKIIDESQVNELQKQYANWKQKILLLSQEKQDLKSKLGGELQEQEQDFLRKIKEQNLNLLRVSKQKNEVQKIMREKLIETCKSQMKL